MIWFVFGVAICALSFTGLIIFMKRIRQRHNTHFSQKFWESGRYVMYVVLIIPTFFGSLLFAKSMDWLPRLQFVAHQIVSIEYKKSDAYLREKR